MDSEILHEYLILEDEVKCIQWKLTVSAFREVEYLHLRKYYLSFDEGYMPSKEGAAFPASIGNVAALFTALLSVLETAEAVELVLNHIKDEDLVTKSRIQTLIEEIDA